MERISLVVHRRHTSLLGLCLHSFVVSYLVRHRTQELSDALNRQRELEMETRSASTRLEKLQRIGIINQMGSIFAHEIRQPLSAIGCFAYSLRRLIERRGSRQDMLEAIEAIEKKPIVQRPSLNASALTYENINGV